MFKGRKRQQIALAMIDEIAKYVDHPMVVGKPDFLRGIFADVCLRSDFLPSEVDARKIFRRVEREIKAGISAALVAAMKDGSRIPSTN
jgi:hypothetical protein